MQERLMTPGAWKYLKNFRAHVRPDEEGNIVIRIPFGKVDSPTVDDTWAEDALKNAMFCLGE